MLGLITYPTSTEYMHWLCARPCAEALSLCTFDVTILRLAADGTRVGTSHRGQGWALAECWSASGAGVLSQEVSFISSNAIINRIIINIVYLSQRTILFVISSVKKKTITEPTDTKQEKSFLKK